MNTIRTNIEDGTYISLCEQRAFIKWCIENNYPTNKIVEKFSKYKKSKSKLAFQINEIRGNINK